MEKNKFPHLKKKTLKSLHSSISDIYDKSIDEPYDIVCGAFGYSILIKGLGSTFHSVDFFEFALRDKYFPSTLVEKSRSKYFGYKLCCLPFNIKLSILDLYNRTKSGPYDSSTDPDREFACLIELVLPSSTVNHKLEIIFDSKEIELCEKGYIAAVREHSLISMDFDNRLLPETRTVITNNYDHCKKVYLESLEKYLQTHEIDITSDPFIHALFKPLEEHHILLFF